LNYKLSNLYKCTKCKALQSHTVCAVFVFSCILMLSPKETVPLRPIPVDAATAMTSYNLDVVHCVTVAVSSWFASHYLRRPCHHSVRPRPRVPHTTSRRASGDVLRVPHRPVLTSSQITGCLFDLDSISLHPTSIHARVKHPRTVPQLPLLLQCLS